MRKPVTGYEGYYEVSDEGKVFRVASNIKPEREMKQQLNTDSSNKNKAEYFRVFLTKNNKQRKYFVHRLVATAFIENPLKLPEVNHKDFNKTNNCKENLEWCSHTDNMIHAINNGRLDNLLLSNIVNRKPVVGVNIKTGQKVEFESAYQAKLSGFDDSSISKCCLGKSKKHKGYTWRFKNIFDDLGYNIKELPTIDSIESHAPIRPLMTPDLDQATRSVRV